MQVPKARCRFPPLLIRGRIVPSCPFADRSSFTGLQCFRVYIIRPKRASSLQFVRPLSRCSPLHIHLLYTMGNLISFRSSPAPAPAPIKVYVLSERESCPALTLHSEKFDGAVFSSSKQQKASLRQTLIKFLDTVDYSFTTYPGYQHLEQAVKTEILSYGVNLRPGWEARLRSACGMSVMAYTNHPIEIQFSITVCISFFIPCGNVDSFSCILDHYMVRVHHG